MTAAEERELLADYLATCQRLHDGFIRAAHRAAQAVPVTAEEIDQLGIEREDMVLAFLKRFEQFEDALARTLKTVAQIMSLGKIERMTARDIANRAEAFGIVADADQWAEAVRTRTALAHEYPLRPDKRAQQVNRAWDARGTLIDTWASLRAFVHQEGLVDEQL